MRAISVVYRSVVAAALLFGVGLCGCESDEDMDDDVVAGSVPSSDRQFATDAARDGMAEVHMGQMGVDRGQNARVRQFAQKMIDDHTRANNDLKSVAMSKGISLPTSMGGAHDAAMDKIDDLSGASFDREYMKMMVKDHEKAVSLFERQASNGSDPQLRDFAQRTLPTLREHLRMAREIAKEVGA